MKRFGAAILQLKAISPNTGLQVVKQAIRPKTQLLDSLSLYPPTTVDELFQKESQYAMLEDDTIVATK